MLRRVAGRSKVDGHVEMTQQSVHVLDAGSGITLCEVRIELQKIDTALCEDQNNKAQGPSANRIGGYS